MNQKSKRNQAATSHVCTAYGAITLSASPDLRAPVDLSKQGHVCLFGSSGTAAIWTKSTFVPPPVPIVGYGLP